MVSYPSKYKAIQGFTCGYYDFTTILTIRINVPFSWQTHTRFYKPWYIFIMVHFRAIQATENAPTNI